MLVHVLLSILFGFSLSILVVEKGEDWPVVLITKPIKFILGLINNKLAEMLNCTVCTSFWTCLIGEIVLKFHITGLFLWPFTGIIALGFTWLVIEILNILDKNRSDPPCVK